MLETRLGPPSSRPARRASYKNSGVSTSVIVASSLISTWGEGPHGVAAVLVSSGQPVLDCQPGDNLEMVVGSEQDKLMRAGDGGDLNVERRNWPTYCPLFRTDASEELGGGLVERPEGERRYQHL